MFQQPKESRRGIVEGENMTLESKSKKTSDITCTLDQMRLDDANVFLDKKWVSLEEAQNINRELKLIADSETDSLREFMNYQLRQKDGIIDRLNETIENEETENIALQSKIDTANKIFDNIYGLVMDEWCRTDDCPDCEDCSFFGQIKRLWETLKK